MAGIFLPLLRAGWLQAPLAAPPFSVTPSLSDVPQPPPVPRKGCGLHNSPKQHLAFLLFLLRYSLSSAIKQYVCRSDEMKHDRESFENTLLRLHFPFVCPVDQGGGFLPWVTMAACLVACLCPQCSFGGSLATSMGETQPPLPFLGSSPGWFCSCRASTSCV